ncbi:hypothetical protein E2542_SST13786 [Spatholobus suberectus]|nr:hypothetical protein E2542_SST13786 [Spatholobus suberectus]
MNHIFSCKPGKGKGMHGGGRVWKETSAAEGSLIGAVVELGSEIERVAELGPEIGAAVGVGNEFDAAVGGREV